MKLEQFVNLAIILGISYDRLDNKQRAYEVLVHLAKENFQEIEKWLTLLLASIAALRISFKLNVSPIAIFAKKKDVTKIKRLAKSTKQNQTLL